MRLIRLYKNRRLYDSAQHAYITYDDLVALLNKEIEFQIEDKSTRSDCTRRVLVEVLLATAARSRLSGGHPVATDETLRLLIRLPATVAPALVGAFLDHTMSSLSSETQTGVPSAPNRSFRARIA